MALRIRGDTVRNFAWILGIGFLLIGVLGFIEALTPNDRLLGLFAVNPAHNWVHILSGLLGIGAAMSDNPRLPLSYTWFVGIAYGLVTILGFFMAPMDGGRMLLGFIHINMADNWLHLLITLAAFAVIFAVQRRPVYR